MKLICLISGHNYAYSYRPCTACNKPHPDWERRAKELKARRETQSRS